MSQSFDNAAGIVFQWHPSNFNLPAPTTGVWPNQSEFQFYIDYAASHRSALEDFGTFFVGHHEQNRSLTCFGPGITYGVSSGLLNNPNHVSSDPKERFTFIFLTDAEAVLADCQTQSSALAGPDALTNGVIGMVTHEVGHQRLG